MMGILEKAFGSHRGTERFRLRQEWTWDDPVHYDLAFIIEREGPAGRTTIFARYHLSTRTGGAPRGLTSAGPATINLTTVATP